MRLTCVPVPACHYPNATQHCGRRRTPREALSTSPAVVCKCPLKQPCGRATNATQACSSHVHPRGRQTPLRDVHETMHADHESEAREGLAPRVAIAARSAHYCWCCSGVWHLTICSAWICAISSFSTSLIFRWRWMSFRPAAPRIRQSCAPGSSAARGVMGATGSSVPHQPTGRTVCTPGALMARAVQQGQVWSTRTARVVLV